MSYLQKNINIFLLVLVVAISVVVAGSSVYYQTTLTNVSSKLENTTDLLGECNADLDNTQFRLNKTISSLNFTVQDIRRYDTLYENKSMQLVSTERSLSDTSKELALTKTKLDETSDLYEKYYEKYSEQKSLNNNLVQEISNLEALNSAQESEIANLKDEIDELEDEKAACGCSG
jgi:chromosome segregation ATPase